MDHRFSGIAARIARLTLFAAARTTTRRRHARKRLALAPLVAILATGGSAAADPRFGANDVRSTFVISKNIDHNVVEYAIHLDKDCLPIGSEPMYAYWRQYDKGANVTEDLNLLDRTVYGIKDQSILHRGSDDARIRLTVKAAPDRPITIIVKKVDGKCTAEPLGVVAGKMARLKEVFVHVAGIMSVDWVEIRGVANGQPLVERVKH